MKLDEDRMTLGSMLLASPDPDRLEKWYRDLFSFGTVPVLYDKRDEITGDAVEPTRLILNFHVNDIKRACAALDARGVEWVAPLEERDGGMWFATTKDPDGNLVQIIQVGDELIRSSDPVIPFSGFSVRSASATQTFYSDVLGLRTVDLGHDMTAIFLSTGVSVLAYPKENHEPATFTVLNIPVDDIDAEADALIAAGVEPLRYEGFQHDDRGIARSSGGEGPDMLWFTDPSGNILALMGL